MGTSLITVSSRGPMLEMWWGGHGPVPVGAQSQPAGAPTGLTLTCYAGTRHEGDTNEYDEHTENRAASSGADGLARRRRPALRRHHRPGHRPALGGRHERWDLLVQRPPGPGHGARTT